MEHKHPLEEWRKGALLEGAKLLYKTHVRITDGKFVNQTGRVTDIINPPVAEPLYQVTLDQGGTTQVFERFLETIE